MAIKKTKQEKAGDALRAINKVVKNRDAKGGSLGVAKAAAGDKPAAKKPVAKAPAKAAIKSTKSTPKVAAKAAAPKRAAPAKAVPKPKAAAKPVAKKPAAKAPAKPVAKRGRPKSEAKAKAEAAKKKKLAAEMKAGLRTGTRGRPKKAENVAKEKALAKKRETRAAEGKSAKGRVASDTSRRSMAKTRGARREAEFKQTLSSKKEGMQPVEVRNKWKSLPASPSDSSMGEKGLHSRGKTMVSFGAKGSQKYRRREFTFNKGKRNESKVKVFQSLKHDQDSNRYVPHRSVRDVEHSKLNHSETVDHLKSGGQIKRVEGIKFGAKKGESKQYKYTKTKGGAREGAVPASLEHLSAVGRSAHAENINKGKQTHGQFSFGKPGPKQDLTANRTVAKAGQYKMPAKPEHQSYSANRYETDSTLQPKKAQRMNPASYVHRDEPTQTSRAGGTKVKKPGRKKS